MQFKSLQAKRQFISNKIVVAIDPAKRKHQATVLDSNGIQLGKSFKFTNDSQGYSKLWYNVKKQVDECKPEKVVFAIEVSCNLWQNLSFHHKLKQYPCPHYKLIGFIILHGFLRGYDESSPIERIIRGRRIYCSNT